MAYKTEPHWNDDTKALRVKLPAGVYIFEAQAGTWGGGSIALKKQGPDLGTGSTDLTVYTVSAADGASPKLNLPSGDYALAVTTATGINARLLRVGEIR